jgi:hypothetical protein
VTSIDEQDLEADLAAVANTFLVKPYRLDRLVTAVDRAAA